MPADVPAPSVDRESAGMVLTASYRQYLGSFHCECALLMLNKIQDMIQNVNTSFINFKTIQHVKRESYGSGNDVSNSRKILPETFSLDSFKLLVDFFSCNQAALWMVQSVRPSVTPFSLYFHYCIIMKFSVVIAIDISDVHAKAKVKGQRSRSQGSKFNLAISGL